MFTYEFRFYPKQLDEYFLGDYMEPLQIFLKMMSNGGQILRVHQNTILFDDYFAVRVVLPEKEALQEKYRMIYYDSAFKRLLELSAKNPEFIFVAENYDESDVCECLQPAFYVLNGSVYQGNSTPVLCGECRLRVPLYRLPKTYDDGKEYHDVLGWKSIYDASDAMFMNGMGERYGYKMMHDPKSVLSVEGRRICALWEQLTGKPFYYFLFKYYGKNKKFCAVCGQDWVNKDEKFGYRYVCHKCRLVSDDID